jgi:hypothetical protein
MAKGKTKTGGRSGSDSGNNSRSSASDLKHDKKQLRSEKSLKAGTNQRGKLKESQGGSKRET